MIGLLTEINASSVHLRRKEMREKRRRSLGRHWTLDVRSTPYKEARARVRVCVCLHAGCWRALGPRARNARAGQGSDWTTERLHSRSLTLLPSSLSAGHGTGLAIGRAPRQPHQTRQSHLHPVMNSGALGQSGGVKQVEASGIWRTAIASRQARFV